MKDQNVEMKVPVYGVCMCVCVKHMGTVMNAVTNKKKILQQNDYIEILNEYATNA